MIAMDQDRFVLHIKRETHVSAAPEIVFQSMLEQLGPSFVLPDGKASPMKLEAWPGGRWFRDLGNNTAHQWGHLWGHVQVIKPLLLEINGPMFMSYAAAGHVQYRVTPADGGAMLSITHTAIGDIPPEQRAGATAGWEYILNAIARRATH